jgi:hypothetical protein
MIYLQPRLLLLGLPLLMLLVWAAIAVGCRLLRLLLMGCVLLLRLCPESCV